MKEQIYFGIKILTKGKPIKEQGKISLEKVMSHNVIQLKYYSPYKRTQKRYKQIVDYKGGGRRECEGCGAITQVW